MLDSFAAAYKDIFTYCLEGLYYLITVGKSTIFPATPTQMSPGVPLVVVPNKIKSAFFGTNDLFAFTCSIFSQRGNENVFKEYAEFRSHILS